MPDSLEKKQANPFGSFDDLPAPHKKKPAIDMDAIGRAEKASGYVPPEAKKPAPLKKEMKPKTAAKPKPAPKLTALQKRRLSKPKPETERYTARLEPDTILYFVDYAEEHNLPMREVFKRAAAALKTQSE